jgi:peptidoglycan/LPS O-acetylase OafA/YrhL
LETIGSGLRLLFGAILYPIIVTGVFAYLVLVIFLVVAQSEGDGRVRRVTAALLPIAALVFLLIPKESESIANSFSYAPPSLRFLIGALFGIALLELGRYLSEKDSEIGSSLYILFLSVTDAFILYAIIEQALRSLHVLLLGMVIAGGLQIIFRGPPRFRRARGTVPHSAVASASDAEGQGGAD